MAGRRPVEGTRRCHRTPDTVGNGANRSDVTKHLAGYSKTFHSHSRDRSRGFHPGHALTAFYLSWEMPIDEALDSKLRKAQEARAQGDNRGGGHSLLQAWLAVSLASIAWPDGLPRAHKLAHRHASR